MAISGTYAPGTSPRARQQVERYEATDGREGGLLRGRPVVILTSLGARSGRVRKTPVMRVEHDGSYAVVASDGGAGRRPGWYHNLRANPHVALRDGERNCDYLAREVTGDERDTWWAWAVTVWPDYARYAQRAGRELPILVLEPMRS